MRRADRLFEIVQRLRGGRLVTAGKLAERLEVSERTIYRDIADLKANGVPIDGEAGIGYILRSGYDLPPLMFTRAEIGALVLGIRMARAWGGLETAAAAEEALVKLEAVLPEKDRPSIARVPMHAFGTGITRRERALFDQLDSAITNKRKVAMAYLSLDGEASTRTIRPLGMGYWGKVWTLAAWCELRDDFRSFRLDRIETLDELGDHFRDEKGQTLNDFYRRMRDRAWD